MSLKIQVDETETEAGPPEGLTGQLIDLCRSVNTTELPLRVQRRAKHSLLDALGMMLLGASAKPVASLRRVLIQPGTDGPVTTMLEGFPRTGPVDAALINGTAAHTMDYDDAGAGGHISSALVPGSLAIGEMHETSGREFLSGLVAGYETSKRLNSLLSESCYDRGFHGSSLVAPFAVAVGGCRQLGLSRHQWDMALGIIGSLSSGIRSNFPTMTKGLHAGHAASNGVLACLLAADEYTGASGVLEGYAGFMTAHTDDPVDEMVIRPLGDPYALDSMVYKAHAACFSTHSATDGMQKLIFDAGIPTDQVEKVRIQVTGIGFNGCNIQRPRTIYEIKFSIRFMAAAGALGYNTADKFFDDDSCASDPAINAFMEKITIERLPDVYHGGENEIEVTLTDGSKRTLRLNSLVPESDLDTEWETVVEKFRRATSPRLGSRADEVIARVEHLEKELSMRTFVRELDNQTS